jgi:hypothetical protein
LTGHYKIENFEKIDEELDEGELEKRGSRVKRSISDPRRRTTSAADDNFLEVQSPDIKMHAQESEKFTKGSAKKSRLFDNNDTLSSIKRVNSGKNSKNGSHDF